MILGADFSAPILEYKESENIAMLKTYKYKMAETEYDMSAEPLNSALFTTGNGYMGIRGSFEEFGSLRIQGAYIRGLIDEITEIVEPFCDNDYMKHYYIDEVKLKHFEKQESIINFADILFAQFVIDGETFYPWEGKILSWERYLDTKRACLVREVVWENTKGQQTKLSFERFASMDNDHIYCIKTEVTPLNYSAKVEVISGIDTRVKTNGQHIAETAEAETCDNKVYVRTNIGKKFNFEIATSAVSNVSVKDTKWSKADLAEGVFAVKTEVDAKKDEKFIFEKILYITSSRDTEDLSPKYPEFDYTEGYNKHIEAYTKVLDVVDCKIEGDDEADGAVRFSNYHSIISVAKNDSIHGLSAKGLTGEKYNNFVWWDSEIYQLPIFIYTMPEAAKQAILYRYNMLNQARENAKLDGTKGAKFAFCSSVNGDEKVWEYARHPFMQIHINADVAYGVIHYYTVTGDDEFMKQYGLEILAECCRYWESRVEDRNGRFELTRVTGSDEHHPYVGNDAYTNYLVKIVMSKGAELCESFGVYTDETTGWRNVADKLYQPIEKSGLIPQFDGYFDLSRSLEEAGNGSSKNFQMKTSGLYHKSQIIKQPDVMLLFSYLNIPFDKYTYEVNWDYYEHMCESSSSLSFAPHSICSADNGRMLSAYNYLMETAYIDVKDIHNCGWQGVHSGCAAGAWYAVFRGIGGVVCREDKIEINPHMMPWWNELSFKFYYKGSLFTVAMTDSEYILSTDSKEPVAVEFKGEKATVSAADEIKFAI